MKNRARVIATALVVGVTVTGCGQGGGGAKKAGGGAPMLAVDVAKAQRQSIATYLTLDGQIAPLQESTLSSPQSGTLLDVYVNEGTRVSRGQLLAKLDDSTLRAQLAANQAQVSQAEAGVRSSTLQNPITQNQVGTAVSTAQQQVATAQTNLISAQAALRNAKLVYDSNRALLKQGYVSQTTFEQARSQYVAAQQQIGVVQAALRTAQASVALARGNTAQTGVQQQDIASKQGLLAQAHATVQLLQAQIAQTNVTAPFDGIVTARLLDPGAFAGPNQPIVRVSQLATVYVNVNVPDNDLQYVRRGTEVTFTTSSNSNRRYTGTIFDINATPTQGTLSYRARIREDNPDASLRGGMLVSVSVRQEYHPNAVVVPRTAIFTNESGTNVFTVVSGPKAPAGGTGAAAGGPPPPAPQKAVEVPVALGLQTDTLSEVRSPQIGPGTTVITTRPDALQNGSSVAVVGPRSGAGRRRNSQ